LLAAIVSGAFIVYRHRENMQRLRAGTENVISLRGRGR
jgi:glycerol-3-phosphate acyltransferase PlsY